MVKFILLNKTTKRTIDQKTKQTILFSSLYQQKTYFIQTPRYKHTPTNFYPHNLTSIPLLTRIYKHHLYNTVKNTSPQNPI